MRQSGKTLALLREAAAAQQSGSAVVVIYSRDFERYCRALAAAKEIDLTGVRFMTHDQIVRGEWRGRLARYFLDQGPSPPLGFWGEWFGLRNWLEGRYPAAVPRKPKPWSAGKESEMFPSLHGLPAHEPKPLPGTVAPLPSTGVVMSPRGVPTISLPGKPGIAKFTIKVDSSQPKLTTTEEQEPAAPASKRTHEGDGD